MTTLERPEDLRRYQRYEFSMAAKLAGERAAGSRVLEVSHEGARVATRRKLEVGDKVGIEVFLQESDPFPIRLVGECRWTAPTATEEIIAGLDLSDSHSRNLTVLQGFLKRLMT